MYRKPVNGVKRNRHSHRRRRNGTRARRRLPGFLALRRGRDRVAGAIVASSCPRGGKALGWLFRSPGPPLDGQGQRLAGMSSFAPRSQTRPAYACMRSQAISGERPSNAGGMLELGAPQGHIFAARFSRRATPRLRTTRGSVPPNGERPHTFGTAPNRERVEEKHRCCAIRFADAD
ncbi:hypothetical protein MRX96_041882 [Rhipicephalus microplus]